MISSLNLQRLAFIKHLYEIGVENARSETPFSWTSVLNFHDSLELFLNLAADYVGIDYKPKQSLFEIWKSVDERIAPNYLAQNVAVKRLVRAREGLKHGFVVPSQDQINEFVYTMRIFFEENVQKIFDLQFDQVNLYIILPKEDRNNFEEADILYAEGKKREALIKLDDIWDHYARAGVLKEEWKDRRIYEDYGSDVVNKLAEEIEHHLIELGLAITVVGYGISISKYKLFEIIFSVKVWSEGNKLEITDKEFKFCKNFLTEFIMKVANVENQLSVYDDELP